MITNGECIQVLLDTFRDLINQFASRDWGRFLLPVFHRDLETH